MFAEFGRVTPSVRRTFKTIVTEVVPEVLHAQRTMPRGSKRYRAGRDATDECGTKSIKGSVAEMLGARMVGAEGTEWATGELHEAGTIHIVWDGDGKYTSHVNGH